MLEFYSNWNTERSEPDCSHNLKTLWAKYVKHMFPSSHNSESCHITINIIYSLSQWTKLQIHVTQLKPPTVILPTNPPQRHRQWNKEVSSVGFEDLGFFLLLCCTQSGLWWICVCMSCRQGVCHQSWLKTGSR